VSQPGATFNGHLGLAGMRERVESLGGTFSVQSEPGKGTRVTARLALRAEDGNDGR
jgi:signal transduction histidine kinase